MLARECPFVATGLLPLPALLPNLRDAFRRRADIFGPVEPDAVPMAPGGPWQALGAVARRIAEALDRRRAK